MGIFRSQQEKWVNDEVMKVGKKALVHLECMNEQRGKSKLS